MKYILTFLMLIGLAQAQTTLTFTAIPQSDPEFLRPLAGAEDWYMDPFQTQDFKLPLSTSPDSAQDTYWRFQWTDVQNDAGTFSWTYFDSKIQWAIDHGRKFNFGIFAYYPGQGNTVGGAHLSYPLFVHTDQQAEPTLKDCIDAYPGYYGYNSWTPNWNATSYISNYCALMRATRNHLLNTTYAGVRLFDAVGYVDIRSFGLTGEWTGYNTSTNVWPDGSGTPHVTANSLITDATQIRLIDSMVAEFPDKQLVIPVAAVFGTAASDGAAGNAVGYKVFTTSNGVGRIGLRRDCTFQTDAFWSFLLENNPVIYGGLVFKDEIMNMYKVAPWVGEPCNCCAIDGNGVWYGDAGRQVRLYHLEGFGNGNLNGASTTRSFDSLRAASKASGFRLRPTTGTNTSNPITNGTFAISLNWINDGVAPTYETWVPTFQLINASNSVVWSAGSLFNPKLFLPTGSATTINDTYTLTGVPAGTYSLVLVMKDPTGYRDPMPLAITGRRADGSYLLRSSITITNGAALPVANAGTDQTISLPTNTATLTGAASTGTITAYLWTQLSGPNTAGISSATTVTTGLTGLIQGTYVFDLSVNAGISHDQVTVLVNPVTPNAVSVFTTQTPLVPQTYNDNNGSGNTLGGMQIGVRVHSAIDGFITGIKFYKTQGNAGTHIAQLYSNTGTLLASTPFAAETATGWQTAIFPTPVAITAGTSYVASYFSSLGNYTEENNYFTHSVTNVQLSFNADASGGAVNTVDVAGTGNGLYKYTAGAAFPNILYLSANYWVDITFATAIPNVQPCNCFPGTGGKRIFRKLP